MTKPLLQLYFEGIKAQVEPIEAYKAIIRIVSRIRPSVEKKFKGSSSEMPSIADIVIEAKKPNSYLADSDVDAKGRDETDAREAASLIIQAVKKFGWPAPEDAKNFMGSLAWAVVERQGGWASICKNLNDSNLGIHQAQWRELAKSILDRSRRGETNPPELPGGLNSCASLPEARPEIQKLLNSDSEMKKIPPNSCKTIAAIEENKLGSS